MSSEEESESEGEGEEEISESSQARTPTEEEDEDLVVKKREDAFICLIMEKDLRHYESVRIKAQYFTGILLRVKNLTATIIENVVKAIEVDNLKALEHNDTEAFANDNPLKFEETGVNSIVNLIIAETRMTKRTMHSLSFWIRKKHLLHSFGINKVKFEDKTDFKILIEAVTLSKKISKLSICCMNFDTQIFGNSIGECLKSSSSLLELEIDKVSFDHPRSFYDMFSPVIHKHSRLNTLKVKGVLFTTLEVRVLQLIIMNNKLIHTMDFSECIDDSKQEFSMFLCKFGQLCTVRYLTLDDMKPDMTNCIEDFGEAMGRNKKLEVLSMQNNKIKSLEYTRFWINMCGNSYLKKLNVSKTELNDKVCFALSDFLRDEHCRVRELDISKNQITDIGLKSIAFGLMGNNSVKNLNLEGNHIKSEGLLHFAQFLIQDSLLETLNLSNNRIINEGLVQFSNFLEHNKTLKTLDISRNAFQCYGFSIFVMQLQKNKGMETLKCGNKDLQENGSLIDLAQAIGKNRCLQKLDLNGIRIRKAFLKNYLEPALQSNITLCEIYGKFPYEILEKELQINQMIRDKIYPCFSEKPKIRQRIPFNFALVDPDNTSFLNISNKPTSYILPSFKFMTFHDVRAIDFSNTDMQDRHVYDLCQYLGRNPSLYSVTIDKNPFGNRALQQLCCTLRDNTVLAHLSFRNCANITDVGLEKLLDVMCKQNMVLFQIDLDITQFDEHMASELIKNTQLNRAIQQILKPKLVVTQMYDHFGIIQGKVQTEVDAKMNENDFGDLNLADVSGSMGKALLSKVAVKSQSEEQEELDKHEETVRNLDRVRYIRQVELDPNASVIECFDSLMKVYRIYQPNIVEMTDKKLTDVELIQLIDHMKDKEIITRLNLRRNKIRNRGVKALAEFITKHDSTLTEINLNRNLITQDGVQALLNAIHGTIRFSDIKIGYGNKSTPEQIVSFEQEVKANIQIKKNLKQKLNSDFQTIKDVFSCKVASNRFRRTKLEIVDQGADFLRCVVKTTQLLNVLHLNLKDNLLCKENAILLCYMLKNNPQLRILNLSYNCFDSECGLLFGEALVVNDNLKSLDLSYNRLGDLGVRNLLYPLLRDGIKEQKPIIANNNMTALKKLAAARRQKKEQQNCQNVKQIIEVSRAASRQQTVDSKLLLEQREEIENRVNILNQNKTEETTLVGIQKSLGKGLLKGRVNLNTLNLEENYMTQESLRHIWMMLELFGQLVIKISKPEHYNWNHPYDDGVDEDNKPNDSPCMSLDTVTDETPLTSQSDEIVDESGQNYEQLKKYCCFRDFNQMFNEEDRKPDRYQICCWRYLRSRQNSTEFVTSKKIRAKLESPFQKVLSIIMVANYIGHLICCILPFLFLIFTGGKGIQNKCSRKLPGFSLVPVFYLLYTGLFEAIVIFLINMDFGFEQNCCYVSVKVLSGFFRKLAFLTQVILAAFLMVAGPPIQTICGVMLFLLAICGQYITIKLLWKQQKVKVSNLLQSTERNQRVARAVGYDAIAAIFTRLSIKPNSFMKQQSKKLQVLIRHEKRHKHEIRKQKMYYKGATPPEAQGWFNFKQQSTLVIYFNAIPLIVIGILGHFMTINKKHEWPHEQNQHKSFFLVMIIGLIQLLSQLLKIWSSNPNIIVNAAFVYKLSNDRIEEYPKMYKKWIGPDANADSQDYDHNENVELKKEPTAMQKLKILVKQARAGKIQNKMEENESPELIRMTDDIRSFDDTRMLSEEDRTHQNKNQGQILFEVTGDDRATLEPKKDDPDYEEVIVPDSKTKNQIQKAVKEKVKVAYEEVKLEHELEEGFGLDIHRAYNPSPNIFD